MFQNQSEDQKVPKKKKKKRTLSGSVVFFSYFTIVWVIDG